MKQRIYVGARYSIEDIDRIQLSVFSSKATPTVESHGKRYIYVVGPFRTLRAAEFMAEYGPGNPHCQTVADAERLASHL